MRESLSHQDQENEFSDAGSIFEGLVVCTGNDSDYNQEDFIAEMQESEQRIELQFNSQL